MRSVLAVLFASLLINSTLAKVVCDKTPPPSEQIPRLQDCNDLIEDIFTISKLEDDEKITWSHNPTTGLGSRKLPFHFIAPSVNNDCMILVDSFKEDQEDTFSLHDVGVTASEVVKTCLEGKPGGVETIGAQIIGPKRVMVVVLLRNIPEPPGVRVYPANRNRTGTILQLPGFPSSMYADLAKSSDT